MLCPSNLYVFLFGSKVNMMLEAFRDDRGKENYGFSELFASAFSSISVDSLNKLWLLLCDIWARQPECGVWAGGPGADLLLLAGPSCSRSRLPLAFGEI